MLENNWALMGDSVAFEDYNGVNISYPEPVNSIWEHKEVKYV